MQHAREPDRLGRQVAARDTPAGTRGIALVEDQVQHVQHRPEPLGPLRAGGHGERSSRVPDALLGTADPLSHGRLGHEEGPRDLGGGQAADRAKGQWDRRPRRQRRVAAHEQQQEGVVVLRHLRRSVDRREALAPPARELGSPPLGHPARRDRDQPAMRAVGQAVYGPLPRSGEQRLLYRVLAVFEAAVPPRDGAEDLRRQLPQQVLDAHRGHHSSGSGGACITGRTWISFATPLPPGPGAADVLAAISTARSSESTSTSQ
jgi:hypothetical protein